MEPHDPTTHGFLTGMSATLGVVAAFLVLFLLCGGTLLFCTVASNHH